RSVGHDSAARQKRWLREKRQVPSSSLLGRERRQITGNLDISGPRGERREALGKDSQAPPLRRQRKPYLTGSPPSRQVRRCRQNLSHKTIIMPRLLWANMGKYI